jgi:hypothetical protein
MPSGRVNDFIGISSFKDAPTRWSKQPGDEHHENCPRNTLGASTKNARETVTLVWYEE